VNTDGLITVPRRGRARIIALALVAGALVVAVPAPTSAQVTVDDLEVHLRLAAIRAPMTQVIPVRNEEKRAQQVRVSLGDWVRDSLGNNTFVEYDSLPSSCGARLRAFPTTFQIAPGATEQIRVTYQPAPADTGCWAIVFIETVTPPPARPDRQGSFVTIELRTGVKVYVHRPDAARAGKVDGGSVELVWRPRAPGTASRDSVQVREAVVRFANTGTAHLRIASKVEIRSLDNRLLHTITGPEAVMTPAALRLVRIPLPALPRGDYVAVVLLDYDGDEIAAAQLEFSVAR
jgi:P pilus assembly chaperone PapD